MFYQYVEQELETYIANIRGSNTRDIIRYSITGGKCIRGYIVKHLMETLGGFSDWRPVASIEAVHATSLILDDLPCMDNDRIRRGKPSTFCAVRRGYIDLGLVPGGIFHTGYLDPVPRRPRAAGQNLVRPKTRIVF